jgi:hypothetical protein
MIDNSENRRVAGDDQPDTCLTGTRGIGSKVAPAVALLLLGDSVYAYDDEDSNPVPVSEPSTLGLLAAAAAVGSVVTYIRNKHRK